MKIEVIKQAEVYQGARIALNHWTYESSGRVEIFISIITDYDGGQLIHIPAEDTEDGLALYWNLVRRNIH